MKILRKIHLWTITYYKIRHTSGVMTVSSLTDSISSVATALNTKLVISEQTVFSRCLYNCVCTSSVNEIIKWFIRFSTSTEIRKIPLGPHPSKNLETLICLSIQCNLYFNGLFALSNRVVSPMGFTMLFQTIHTER